MTRVELLDNKVKTVISRSDYEADRKRGFTVIEYKPAGELVIKNPRYPERKVVKQVPAVHMYQCMFCKFNAVDTAYSLDPDTQQPRTGLDIIKKHLTVNKHPWPYKPFDNPYGNIEDVTIEGVEDYSKEIAL